MKAIVSVLGKDKKGIIAIVSGELFKMNINIEDISQTIMQNYFTMIMMVDIDNDNVFGDVQARLKELGSEVGVDINIQRTNIFDAMHKL